MFEFIINIDKTILYWIQDTLQCAFCDKFFVIATYFGEKGIFWLLSAILLIVFPKTRKIGITALAAIAVSFVLSQLVIKNIVGRVRPFEYFDWNLALMLVDIPHDSSFPSSHTAVSFAAGLAILFCDKKFGIPAVIIAVLVAFSRMYLFVHYPSDVLAGIILGTIVAVAAFFSVRKIMENIEDKKAIKQTE